MERRISAMEMVGKTMGSAPASRTPRLTDSMRSGTLPWQGLKSDAVLVNADDGAVEGRSSEVAGGLDEGLAEEEREGGVAVVGGVLCQEAGIRMEGLVMRFGSAVRDYEQNNIRGFFAGSSE